MKAVINTLILAVFWIFGYCQVFSII